MHRTRDCCKRLTPTRCRAHHIPQPPALYNKREFETLRKTQTKNAKTYTIATHPPQQRKKKCNFLDRASNNVFACATSLIDCAASTNG